MAKKRRVLKPKVQKVSESDEKPTPAKRPRRVLTRSTKQTQLIEEDEPDVPKEVVESTNELFVEIAVKEEEVVSTVEVEELAAEEIVEAPELQAAVPEPEAAVTIAPPAAVVSTPPVQLQDENVSEVASDSSDSSSDSDSSSSSDSDSSDSDSKPATREATPIQLDAPLINSITNHSVVRSFPVKSKSSSSDSYHSDTEEEDKKRRKKQKTLQRQVLTKRFQTRPSRSALRRGSRSDVLDEEEDELAGNDVPDWPEEDFSELLRRMEEQLPVKDSLKFDSRAAKLDWGRIKFNNYSTEDCYEVWVRISKRIRRFRTLNEILCDARDWVTKPWTNFYRGSKKNRHPDMPSRPLSTYMIYYLEQKDRVAGENPGLEMTQISKIISEQYKALSESEKETYTELAAKERISFEEKLSDFYKDHPDMAPNHQPRSNVREKEKTGPRKPSAPFKLYFQEQLKRYADNGVYDRKTVEDLAKESWRAMNDKKKLVWITWSLEELKRYEEELQKYQIDHPEYVPPVFAKNVLNKDERAIKERLSGKPVKPPNSAYSYYSRVMLQSDDEIKRIPPKLRMAEISRKWKEISDAQKIKYEETVRELQEQYKLEFASYLEGLPKEEREEELKKSLPKTRKGVTVKSEVEPLSAPPPSRKQPSRAASSRRTRARAAPPADSAPPAMQLYKGEPIPPPVRAYELFLKTFLAERPSGTSEALRLKEAPRYWEVASEAKKEVFRKNLAELKQKYIKDYELFLKGLSPEELKEFSMIKSMTKRMEDQKEELERRNGSGLLSDSEGCESDKEESSSGSEDENEGGNASDGSKSTTSQSDA